jgi:dipeptidyl aminopeptidase/acylaminoacyl peptidase
MPASPTPPPVASGPQSIAYVYDEQLLVADVANGVITSTGQYTMAGESDKVTDIVWSPSGEFIAFVSVAKGDPHVFYIFAKGASTPTDLGAGSAPAWSPDSRTLAYVSGAYPDENISVTGIDNPSPRQLTSETNHAWGRPAFTPDGQSLIVTTADRNYMGAQGNTSFELQRLSLDGSGTRTSIPGATPLEGVRLPYDLRFSPDGSWFAFSTSGHLSACASPGEYYVSDINGTRHGLHSPSLYAASDPNKELYYEGLSYGWFPTSDAIVETGEVADCNPNSPTMGKLVAGPQMSVVKLDGSEGLIIPGFFYSPSVDHSGTLIAAERHNDLQDPNGTVVIFSAQTGQLATIIGPGNNPVFEP